jgi:hypothetical protein
MYVDTTAQKHGRETKQQNREIYQYVMTRGAPYHIEITHFRERHFWHGGYDKASMPAGEPCPLMDNSGLLDAGSSRDIGATSIGGSPVISRVLRRYVK